MYFHKGVRCGRGEYRIGAGDRVRYVISPPPVTLPGLMDRRPYIQRPGHEGIEDVSFKPRANRASCGRHCGSPTSWITSGPKKAEPLAYECFWVSQRHGLAAAARARGASRRRNSRRGGEGSSHRLRGHRSRRKPRFPWGRKWVIWGSSWWRRRVGAVGLCSWAKWMLPTMTMRAEHRLYTEHELGASSPRL